MPGWLHLSPNGVSGVKIHSRVQDLVALWEMVWEACFLLSSPLGLQLLSTVRSPFFCSLHPSSCVSNRSWLATQALPTCHLLTLEHGCHSFQQRALILIHTPLCCIVFPGAHLPIHILHLTLSLGLDFAPPQNSADLGDPDPAGEHAKARNLMEVHFIQCLSSN